MTQSVAASKPECHGGQGEGTSWSCSDSESLLVVLLGQRNSPDSGLVDSDSELRDGAVQHLEPG
eukprot:1797077-Rhodomonas_salina.1